MSKASGFVLLMAGVAAAAYVLPLGSDTSVSDLLPRFTDLAKLPPPNEAREVVAVTPELPESPPVAAAPERPSVPSFSAPVVVTIAQRPSEPPTPAPQKVGPIPRDRDTIGRELQKELKRVGCYEGELNGIWTPSTRQAMKAFTDRVNATLPTDEPDSILLTLVQAYQDRVCGKSCPAGQGLSDAGRCLPTAILARAGKKGPPVAAATPAPPAEKPAPAITSWSTTTTAAVPTPPTAPVGTPPPEGRMALAGPSQPDATQQPEATPPPGAPPPAATPPAAPKRPKVGSSEGGWARNVFRHQQSLN